MRAQTETTAPQEGLPGFLDTVADADAHPSDEMFQALLHAARVHLDMEIGFISEFRDGRRRFRIVDAEEERRLFRPGDSDPLESTYCQRVVDGRLPRCMSDAGAVPAARELAVTAELGIGAHLSVPIRLADGSVYGTFCCFSLRPDHSLNERDTRYLQAFAEIAGRLIQKEIDRDREWQAGHRRIRDLLDNGGIETVWQPIVEVATGRITGLETLSRFPSVEDRSPAFWFDEAARVGLARELETRAIRQGLALLERVPADTYVSVNASAASLLERDPDELLAGAPLHRVVLEITEHDAVNDYQALAGALAPLRARGLRLAVDDVGAGYASFRHILRLAPDIIKLDLSLIRDVDTDGQKRALVAGIVGFGRATGTMLIAEGVETSAEHAVLQSLGVEAIQGFLLYRPQPLEALREFAAA